MATRIQSDKSGEKQSMDDDDDDLDNPRARAFAREREEYLRKHRPELHKAMTEDGSLAEHLEHIGDVADTFVTRAVMQAQREAFEQTMTGHWVDFGIVLGQAELAATEAAREDLIYM
ncbi:MAG: hypothetical protein KDJ36_10880 [Hyphomicrobiaceae bacterium]|nr:hypothetical protein [Hyphomicrobiaceae bacterium]